MKKITALLLLILVSISFSTEIFSQINSWSDEVRITSGFNDINPQFVNRVYLTESTMNNEFLLFERKSSKHSDIMMFEFKNSGVQNSTPMNLSNSNSLNRNAVLSFNKPTGFFTPGTIINSCLAVWETNRNGKWDLYGKKYNSVTGWSDIVIESDSGDKNNPDIIYISSNIYLIVYEKGGDIFLRKVNILNDSNEVLLNVTMTPEVIEKNPKITFYSSYSQIVLSYEREKQNGNSAIYFNTSISDSINLSETKLLDSTGHNTNLKFFNLWYDGYAHCVYEKSYENKTRLYYRKIQFGNNIVGNSYYMTSDTINNSKNYTNFNWPLVTESPKDNGWGYLFSYACTYQMDVANSSLLIFSNNSYYHNNYMTDTLDIGDTAIKTYVTMNYGISIPFGFRLYSVYTRDSAGVKSLYYKSIDINPGSINQISSVVPESYKLEQNYPNPFNVGTKIRFAVKENNAFVNLSVYDVSGRLIKNLVNEKFNAGEYEYLYDAEGLSSGVYFYSLRAGDFSETKRMVLVK